MTRKDIEIMAPVGSYESLSAAIDAGADSIYFGVGQLNMRSRSSANFTFEDLERIVTTAHSHGVKAYLTVNTVIYDDEIELMHSLVDAAVEHGVDAVIVSDQSAILYARSRGLEVHVSTQLNVSNVETLRFYSQWADVAVLARELSLPQIAYIAEAIRTQDIRGPKGERMKIEMFAHGALCMAVSGKCYLSLHTTGCSANRGACRQICRRSYTLRDNETGEEIAAEGKYLLSPKDLCTIPFLDKFIGAGVRVLKIEGRARSAEYVKTVCRCYSEAVEAVCDGSFDEKKAEMWVERLRRVFNRDFWGGYYLGSPTVELSANYGSSATVRKVFVGKVTNFFKRISVAEIYVEASPLEAGRQILFTGEKTGAQEMTAETVYVNEHPARTAPQGVYCSIKTPFEVRRGDRMFKIADKDEVVCQ